jgi:hypothetical protein
MRLMRFSAAILCATLCLSIAVIAHAADEGESRAIARGRWSLAFSLPDGGGGELGVWKMVSHRTNLGVNLAVDHAMEKFTYGPDSDRVENGHWFWSIAMGPSINRYLALNRTVSPYLLGSLTGTYRWDGVSYQRSATLRAGIGADWTPLESIAIGAATGIEWTEAMRSESRPEAPKASSSLFDTMSTALTLRLFF